MKEFIKKRIFGIIVAAIPAIFGIVCICITAKTALISLKYIIIAAVLIAVAVAGIYLLSRDFKKRVMSILGIILAVITVCVPAVSVYYINHGANALGSITTPSQEYAEIGVYVAADDAAQTLSDIKDYTVGILEVQDRANTDAALLQIEQELSNTPKATAYVGIGELLDGLLSEKEVKAILLNDGFVEMLDEIDGHEEDAARIRKVHTLKVENIKTDDATIKNDDSDAVKTSFTLYITGIDCTGSISRKSRSDVNILATVNTETGQILLVSTPRDYYVPLSISEGVPDKLTHAGIYGTSVSKDTIAMLYDLDIDYYFKVNFDGFREIIDALGGITVNSEYKFTTGDYSFVKGENTLDGEAALAFARCRKTVPGGDRQRGRHQMEVIRAVINKAVSPALLKNYTTILDGVKNSFETEMPYEEIAELVRMQLDTGKKWNITTYSVDGRGASRKPWSLSLKAYVMIPDETTVEHAKELIKQVIDGDVPEV